MGNYLRCFEKHWKKTLYPIKFNFVDQKIHFLNILYSIEERLLPLALSLIVA